MEKNSNAGSKRRERKFPTTFVSSSADFAFTRKGDFSLFGNRRVGWDHGNDDDDDDDDDGKATTRMTLKRGIMA